MTNRIYQKHMESLRAMVQDYLTAYQTAEAARDSARTDHAKAVEDLKKFFGPEEVRLRMELIERGAKIAERQKEDAFQKIRKSRFDLLDRAAEIRARLASDLEKATVADPAEMDTNTLRLIDSGILTAADFLSIYDNASTPTMKRLIGAAAGKAAEATENTTDRAALNSIFSASKSIGSEVLEEYDSTVFGLSCATGTPENPRELSPKTLQFWMEETAESADE